jgi:putative membrane protein
MSFVASSERAFSHQPDVWKGLAAGIVGGLVASWVMEEFQSAWAKLSETAQQNGSQQTSSSNGAQSQRDAEEQEPATIKAAEAVSEKLLGHHLEKNEKELAGNAVHYATGGASGGAYGVAAELVPKVTAGAGLPFGTAVWLVVDETAVPLLGLSKAPLEYPLPTHVYALASHFVFGLTTEAVRRTLRKTILS